MNIADFGHYETHSGNYECNSNVSRETMLKIYTPGTDVYTFAAVIIDN